MASDQRCPRCGAELPPGSLEGLCPKCLMAAGLESGAATIESPLRGSGAATSPDSTRFVPPEPASLAAHFPQLEILELLGHGGMGAVYKARQKNLDRLVALKIIRPEAADTPAFTERFNREARMLARLNHPHIVAIHDFGEVSVSNPGGGSRAPRTLYFFLMEYVGGSSLRQLMRTGDLTPEKALKVVPQICEALQYAHDEGIVHRDIKPENILLDKRGRVKIADFGLAKLAARSTGDFTLTATHHVLGTVRYMAPEQMEGSHAVDHRADIYALGVVFYEMLTGEVPAGHFEPPSKKVQVDVRLDEVVLRALAREPERRYQHASDVKTDVESISGRASNRPMTSASARAEMDEGAPRLSRKAVQGAWAVALSVAAAITVFIAGTGLIALHEGVRGPAVLQWWEYPILLTLGVAFLIGLIGPFAATILGIVAMHEIRHSQGRLVGLGLAFFDAAFFPVVLVEGVIFFVCWVPWAYVWWEILGRPNYDGGFIPFWLLSSLLLSVPIAVLIRSWWRKTVGYTIDDVSLRRKTRESNHALGDEVAARESERRYQHASDVNEEVESIGKLLPMGKMSSQSGEAESAVKKLIPASVGMLVAGLALTLWLALKIAGRLPSDFEDWWVVGLAGPVLFLGGLAMSGGRNYWLAFISSLTCLAIGFATLYFILFLPFVPLAALLVGGYSLWLLMQPDVVEAFRQRSPSGVSFGRRPLVITLTLVLPMLALVCAAPLFMAQVELAYRDVDSRIEEGPEEGPLVPPDSPAPPEPAPDEVILAEGPEEGPDAPARAGSIERHVESGGERAEFYEQVQRAESAFERYEFEAARQLALEYLEMAEKYRDDWNYGNAIHDANAILGRIALSEGNLTAAKEHLLAAAKTPGSPQLNSFGPKLTLAAELLARGEKEAVLQYLAQMATVWQSPEKITRLVASIQRGVTPDELHVVRASHPLTGSWRSEENRLGISIVSDVLQLSAEGKGSVTSVFKETHPYRVADFHLIFADPATGKEEKQRFEFRDGQLVLFIPNDEAFGAGEILFRRIGSAPAANSLVGTWEGTIHVEDVGDTTITQTFDSEEVGQTTIESQLPKPRQFFFTVIGSKILWAPDASSVSRPAEWSISGDELTLTNFFLQERETPIVYRRESNESQ